MLLSSVYSTNYLTAGAGTEKKDECENFFFFFFFYLIAALLLKFLTFLDEVPLLSKMGLINFHLLFHLKVPL